MTAIRPRPSPQQERRAQAQAAQKSQILLSQPRFPLVLAVFYVALLIVPWALTCRIATQPAFIIHVYSRGGRYYVQYGWVIAIKVLNSLAAVLSLPILSALLARAAVVFSQRRRPAQTLNVRQLFALADRDWYNLSNVLSPVTSSALLRLGFLLLSFSILLPLIRSGLVAYDNVLVSSHWPARYDGADEFLGLTPSPAALKLASGSQTSVTSATRGSLRITTGGIDTHLWPVCNDPRPGSTCGFKYGPYDIEQSRLSNFWESTDRSYGRDFETNGSALMHASTFRAGSTIGTYRGNKLGAYTLGLQSGTQCETVSMQEVDEHCIRSIDSGALPTTARGWNTSLEIPQHIRLDICYPPLERDPWEAAAASPWKPINFTEHLYVGLFDSDSSWGCGYDYDGDCGYLGTSSGLYFHCQADSLMSYFEIGEASTKGVPGRLLEEMPAGFDIRRSDKTSDGPSEDNPDTQYFGPLKTATMAMFGNESWADVLKGPMVEVEESNLTIAAAMTMLCSMRPLGDADVFNDNDACEITKYPSTLVFYSDTYLFSSFIRGMLRQFKTRKLAGATLNTATFYANNAVLSALAQTYTGLTQEYKYGTIETDERMSVPVLSVAAIATVSILIALQVVGIVILLVYIYSSRVWTKTLDTLAVARIGAQISALDVFLVPRETGTLGLARLTGRAAKQLEQTDGLVGSTALTGHHDIEMATIPPPYAPRGEEPSTREEQRMPQPGVAAAGDTTASDHPAPSYSPPADEHTTRAPGGEAEAASGRGDSSDMAISQLHAASSESQGAVLPPVTSIEALAVGGRGLIPRRRWKEADKPLPPRPAE